MTKIYVQILEKFVIQGSNNRVYLHMKKDRNLRGFTYNIADKKPTSFIIRNRLTKAYRLLEKTCSM